MGRRGKVWRDVGRTCEGVWRRVEACRGLWRLGFGGAFWDAVGVLVGDVGGRGGFWGCWGSVEAPFPQWFGWQ